MSFRDRMRVRVARAEVQVCLEFSKRMLTVGFQTQIGFTFTPKEVRRFHVYGTVVDGIWPLVKVIWFLDGPPHLKSHTISMGVSGKEIMTILSSSSTSSSLISSPLQLIVFSISGNGTFMCNWVYVANGTAYVYNPGPIGIGIKLATTVPVLFGRKAKGLYG